MLYNEELKERYLTEKSERVAVPSDYLRYQFNQTGEMEVELNKDLSNWTAYEIIDFYKIMNFTSFEVLYCLNSYFSMYCQFCLENSLVKDNQNHFLEITKDIISSCLNKAIIDKKIVTRKTVLKWIDDLPNPKDKFILLSLFEFGKSKDFKNIVYAKKQDMNYNNKTLTLEDGRVVNISDKLIDIIEQCESEDTYYSITGKGAKIMPLIDYGYIVKNYPNANINATDYQKGRNIYISCARIFDYVGVGEWMSPNAIAESGKLFMLKERSSQLCITPMQYLYSDYITEIENQFGNKITRSIYKRKYQEYLV